VKLPDNSLVRAKVLEETPQGQPPKFSEWIQESGDKCYWSDQACLCSLAEQLILRDELWPRRQRRQPVAREFQVVVLRKRYSFPWSDEAGFRMFVIGLLATTDETTYKLEHTERQYVFATRRRKLASMMTCCNFSLKARRESEPEGEYREFAQLLLEDAKQ
jgi:hypothetical protein